MTHLSISGTSVAQPAAMSLPNASRRNFCIHACQAVSLVSIASLVDGCGGSPTSPSDAPPLPVVNGTLAGGTITMNIAAGSPLAAVGGTALVQAGSTNVLVAQTAQDTFVALTAVCTHEGCTVSGFQNQRYVCPCHGSQFSTSGSVVQGPAAAPLRQFATRFASNVLTITLS
jgi:cytochrome b6-f complex iron-sulfur subunit